MKTKQSICMDSKKQSKLGGMFDIPIKDHVFYGCVISYWNIAEQEKPHTISLVLIENQNRLDRIGKITLPTGIRFSLYCGENHIGKYWPIIDYLNVNDIPKFLLRTNIAGHVYEVVPETGEVIYVTKCKSR